MYPQCFAMSIADTFFYKATTISNQHSIGVTFQQVSARGEIFYQYCIGDRAQVRCKPGGRKQYQHCIGDNTTLRREPV